MHSDTQPDMLRTMVFSAVVTALTVLLSPVFSFPLGVTRAFPIQHMANIFLAVLAGTRYGVAAAFTASLIRNIAGTGSLLAFPGSMIGAFLSGWLYSRTHKLWAAAAGEFSAPPSWADSRPIPSPPSCSARKKALSSTSPSSPSPAARDASSPTAR